jgi:hypothetical protein
MSKLELKSIIACNQSDGLLKKWAEKELSITIVAERKNH